VLLAGDIGGTKTHLALYRPGDPVRSPWTDRKFASRDYASLESLIQDFLGGVRGARPVRAVLGIAGPVVDNRVEATNLPWVIDGAALSASLGGAEVILMNDLASTAWGVGALAANDLEVLQKGERTDGNRAVVAAGTGLGEALLIWDNARWIPSASEGGHADFGPRDAFEDELSLWMRAKYGHVSYERLLSGHGIADLYRFMSATSRGGEPAAFARDFAAADDPAALVTDAARDGTCERARLAIERWVEIYGAEAGNVALKFLAVAGLYVAGGIALHVVDFLRDGRFIRAFSAKGRLGPLLARMPVSVVLDARVGLWGAATVALAGARRIPTMESRVE
jgi:glucokinase